MDFAHAVRNGLILGVALTTLACNKTAKTDAAAAGAPQPEAIVQPGAPGQDSKVLTAVPKFNTVDYSQADIEFLQGMIHHHNQAMVMVGWIPTHTKNPQMQLLGEKIANTQGAELKTMRTWLKAHGAEIPMDMAGGMTMMDGKPMAPMPGMLSDAEMKAMDAARDAEFDKLFLQGMIKHHTGALKMVADIRAQEGSNVETNLDDFLIHVDTDQRMDIDRMNGMLGRPAQ